MTSGLSAGSDSLTGLHHSAVSPHERDRRLARDSFALVASYGLTAIVGLAFWALAARLVPAEQLGIDTAIISAFTAAASIAATGLANAILALLPLAGPADRLLVREGYLIAIVSSFFCGLVAGVLVTLLLPGEHSALLLIAGVTGASMVWALFVVQDPVLTAAGYSRWLVPENLPVSFAKLALLPLVVTVSGTATKLVVFAAVAPAAVAVLVISGFLIPRVVLAKPQARVERAKNRRLAQAWMTAHRRTFRLFVLRDGAASALSLGLYMALPFVVTVISGPVAGAVFAVCLQVSAGLDLVTAGVGVSLTTNVAGDPENGPTIAIRTWRRVAMVLCGAAVLLIAAAPLLLLILGPTYVHNGGFKILAILAIGSVLRSTFEVWTALLRAQRRTVLILKCNIVGAALLLACVISLARPYGAVGAALGVTIATCAFSLAGAFGLWRGTALGRADSR